MPATYSGPTPTTGLRCRKAASSANGSILRSVDIPAEHATRGLVTVAHDATGRPFDWPFLMRKFFSVHSVKADKRPAAHVAIQYKDYWFYVDDTDQDTKSTFSLLMELARLELNDKSSAGPQLTLPLSGR